MASTKTATMATLAAGTKFLVSYDDGANFERVPGITAVGDIGEMADTQETTTLEDTTRTYISALATPASKQFVGNLLPEDEAQAKFVKAAQERAAVIVKIIMPTTPKVVGQNDVILLGFQINGPVAENVLQFTVGGQATGKTKWATDSSIEIGSIKLATIQQNVAPGYTMQINATEATTGQAIPATQLSYKSSDTTIATVDEGGLVTGVKNGNFTVTASDTFGTASATIDLIVAEANPKITANWDLAVTSKATESFDFATMFTIVDSEQTDYSVTNNPTVSGVSIDKNGKVTILNTVTASTVNIHATHKKISSASAVCVITINRPA